MLVIVCTITILVPINNRIASWEKFTPPADWKLYRGRWDLLHRWRVVVLATAFVLLIVGIL
jgi:anti-sigma-K factor RskA